MGTLMFEETLENYQVDMYNRGAYLAAKDFVEMRMVKGMTFGVFGLEGVGKTRLLRAMANYFAMEHSPNEVVFVEAMELAEELRAAQRHGDIFQLALKWKYRKAKVICLDGIQVLLTDEELQDWYVYWFHHCKRKCKRLMYTHDCDEKLYCAFMKLADLDPRVTWVGIPKPGQNRNLDVIREVE